jgi:enamine deaminase RidA (YjgF/YER057c/UK114 family)
MKTPEHRLQEMELVLPKPPAPFGNYVESVQTGNLLFLTGMMPTENQKPKYLGVIGENLSAEDGWNAARLACLNGIAVAKEHLGSLERVTRVVRVGAYLVTAKDFKGHPMVADGASQLLAEVFGKEKISTRMVLGMATLPLGVPVELELIFEVKG